MKYEIKDPFGPAIYKATLADDQIKFLKKVADATREKNISRGNNLAGNIQLQLTSDIDDKNYFLKLVGDHVQNYAEHNLNKYKSNVFGSNYDKVSGVDFIISEPGPWINYQRQYEFNPIHSHTGVISSIIYIDIPEEIAKEKETMPINSNTRCPGELGFVHADDGVISNLHVTPATGDMYLFPSNLNHTVYPFHSNVERISMSFNIADLNVYNQEEKQ
jgi:hypothetical protein